MTVNARLWKRRLTVICPVTFGYLEAVSGRPEGPSRVSKWSGTASQPVEFASALGHSKRLLDILLNALNAM
jgi:hypothetical protein